MIILGITGPIGSGKTYVSDMISDRGFKKIDTDNVYHSLVDSPSETVEALAKEFGKEILLENGSIDRKKLSKIVFSDKKKLAKLNEISHKAVIEKTEKLISDYEKNGEKMLLIEVPLMFESGFDKRCDYVVSVVADEETRVERICKRSALSAEEAKKRIKNQKNNDFYIENSSFVIYNSNNGDLNAQINSIIERIFKEKGI